MGQKKLELDTVRGMSEVERSEARMRVAMRSPEQLKQWLQETGRRWLIFDALELVDSLPWVSADDGSIPALESLQQLVACYRDHRATLPSTTGETVEQKDLSAPPHLPRTIQVPKPKSETLELVEIDRCIRYLVGEATKLDSSWSLENPPL